MSDSKPPDYNVGLVVRGTDIKATIGVAWKSDKDDGRISIKLHSLIQIPVASPDLFITLFPRDEKQENNYRNKSAPARRGDNKRGASSDGDDIPF